MLRGLVSGGGGGRGDGSAHCHPRRPLTLVTYAYLVIKIVMLSTLGSPPCLGGASGYMGSRGEMGGSGGTRVIRRRVFFFTSCPFCGHFSHAPLAVATCKRLLSHREPTLRGRRRPAAAANGLPAQWARHAVCRRRRRRTRPVKDVEAGERHERLGRMPGGGGRRGDATHPRRRRHECGRERRRRGGRPQGVEADGTVAQGVIRSGSGRGGSGGGGGDCRWGVSDRSRVSGGRCRRVPLTTRAVPVCRHQRWGVPLRPPCWRR